MRRSTLVKTMEVLYNLIPLHLFIRYEAIASLLRNTHCLPLSWPGHNSACKTYIRHRKYRQDSLYDAQLSISSTDRIYDLNWYKAYSILLNSLNSMSPPPYPKSMFLQTEVKLHAIQVPVSSFIDTLNYCRGCWTLSPPP